MQDKVLLDTHILLWFNGIDNKLKPQMLKQIQPCNKYVSMASYWEIAIKTKKGRLDLGMSLSQFIELNTENGIKTIPIKSKHLIQLDNLPKFAKHNDPFDHLIIATSQAEKLSLVTVDTDVLQYLK